MNQASESSPIVLCSPVMTRKCFSERSGLRLGQIRTQIRNDNLPEFEVGRHKLLNVAAMVNVAAHVLYCPTATAEQFALWSGLTTDQVALQLSEKRLPVKEVGKLRLVDIVALYDQCLAAAGLQTQNRKSA